MASSDSQINKQQHGRPKRAELSDVTNINTGVQSINTERASLMFFYCHHLSEPVSLASLWYSFQQESGMDVRDLAPYMCGLPGMEATMMTTVPVMGTLLVSSQCPLVL